MTTVQTYLPLFTGLYDSVYCPSNFYDEEIVEEINIKRAKQNLPPIRSWDIVYNWKQFHEEIAIKITENVAQLLTQFFGFEVQIEYEELKSPKEYNFENDSINCTIIFNPFSLWRLISKYKKEIDEALANEYTSVDGFSSWYGNSFILWREDYNKNSLNLAHAVGSIMDILAHIIIPKDIRDEVEIVEYDMPEILNMDILVPITEGKANETDRRAEVGKQTTQK